MSRFTEVADRVWVARYPFCDVNVSLVAGSSGLVVVDTYASTAGAQEVLDDVRRVGAGPVTAVVNTHAHFDHCFGNAAFRSAFPDVPIHAHEVAAAAMAPDAERWRSRFADGGDWAGEPEAADVLATELAVADQVFSSAAVVDLGDRLVELVHPGRGHTDGDLVVSVPDAGVLLAGDLVEESGPPAYGPDCWPLQWSLTIETLSRMLTADTVVVPGHGTPVDRDFVQTQGLELGQVSRTIQELAAQGVPAGEALDAGEWPFPREHLTEAVAVGYAQLPRSSKRLPLA